jgi:hypothetical protein
MNERLQLMFIADVIHQQGFLSMPFYRVYFTDNSVKAEALPDSRTKIPLGVRASYFAGDKFILKGFYRYYKDNWGLAAHTLEIETPVKISPQFSIAPFYRYYTQTAIDYFKAKQLHTISEKYYSSNYDLSAFNSNFYGAGFKLMPLNGVLGIKKINMIEFRYGHYSRSNGLSSNIISMNLKFK